jgi:hypothetical protein
MMQVGSAKYIELLSSENPAPETLPFTARRRRRVGSP